VNDDKKKSGPVFTISSAPDANRTRIGSATDRRKKPSFYIPICCKKSFIKQRLTDAPELWYFQGMNSMLYRGHYGHQNEGENRAYFADCTAPRQEGDEDDPRHCPRKSGEQSNGLKPPD
jgi:hypothetical protein